MESYKNIKFHCVFNNYYNNSNVRITDGIRFTKNYSDLSKLFLPLARKQFSLVLKMPWLSLIKL